jgi:endonuclease/exonuclease/phosphatase (EEP) superfamily protein YafD
MIRRALATLLAVGLALFLLVGSWPQLFGVHRTLVFAELTAMRGLLVAVALVAIMFLIVIALVSQPLRRISAVLALVLFGGVALNLAVLSTRGFGDPAFQEKAPADLTVFTWNTLGDAPGAGVIAEFALEHEVDILALPETSREAADEIAARMGQGGAAMQVFVIALDELKSRSTALLVSDGLGTYRLDETAGSTPYLPSVTAVPTDGSGPTIIAAHPVAPIPGYIDDWEPGLEWLAESCRGGNVILAGDLNSTLDHYQGLADDGAALGTCFDGAKQTGNAALGTWPSQLPELLSAPIDHVMATSEWEFVGFRVVGALDGLGSDHRAVLAQLRPVG